MKYFHKREFFSEKKNFFYEILSVEVKCILFTQCGKMQMFFKMY